MKKKINFNLCEDISTFKCLEKTKFLSQNYLKFGFHWIYCLLTFEKRCLCFFLLRESNERPNCYSLSLAHSQKYINFLFFLFLTLEKADEYFIWHFFKDSRKNSFIRTKKKKKKNFIFL